MKKTVSILFAVVLFSGFISLAGTSDKTIMNLKEAFKGETTASAKYAAYAEKAKKEGFMNIALMFEATSRSESIHAGNHKTVLEKMGEKVDPFKPEFKVMTTMENLEDALNGETYEITTMYPGFLATAKSEDAKSAVKSFGWAMDTEKKHQGFYKNAIDALKAGKEASMPKIYWVCPKCGNTFNIARPPDECSFCGTASSKFIKFGK